MWATASSRRCRRLCHRAFSVAGVVPDMRRRPAAGCNPPTAEVSNLDRVGWPCSLFKLEHQPRFRRHGDIYRSGQAECAVGFSVRSRFCMMTDSGQKDLCRLLRYGSFSKIGRKFYPIGSVEGRHRTDNRSSSAEKPIGINRVLCRAIVRIAC